MDKIINLRTEIDDIDNQIMDLLQKRFDITYKIGELKAQSNKVILDTNREQYILDKISKYSHSPSISIVYNSIMKESKNKQRK